MLGDELLKVYNGLTFTTTEEERTDGQTLEQFERFIIGATNETYELFIFNKREQLSDETFECFLSSIRQLMKTCNYHEVSIYSLLRNCIVIGIRYTKTQRMLLRESKLTLARAIDICKANESADIQEKLFKDETSAVNKVRASNRRPRNSSFPEKNSNYNSVRSNYALVKDCKFCGLTHSMRKLECPAWEKNCNKCKRLNHFEAKYPKSNTIHSVYALANSSDSKMEETAWIHNLRSSMKSSIDVKRRMLVDNQNVTFQVDTEDSVNIIPQKFASRCHIAPTSIK
ncbi:unnamed protein product [Lepeophtheirus salmonis]|uniref:(salmon louse) hypothetical protein n=1 Tax=Lepeophtheirus salmonis TaxID=72036 RepID=A0A7R8CY15_LEPSM|nr:unnamed protein product [Lepeophtheirus salmonis]CAF2966689.1 unnamed protein product [Lepeophtheirus salmonis]